MLKSTMAATAMAAVVVRKGKVAAAVVNSSLDRVIMIAIQVVDLLAQAAPTLGVQMEVPVVGVVQALKGQVMQEAEETQAKMAEPAVGAGDLV